MSCACFCLCMSHFLKPHYILVQKPSLGCTLTKSVYVLYNIYNISV